MIDQEQGAHDEFIERPLIQIRMSDDAILITLRTQSGKEAAKYIRTPTHLWVEETETGAHKSLLILSPEGMEIISFRTAKLPEEMDGMP
jgi:hypothetical protein